MLLTAMLFATAPAQSQDNAATDNMMTTYLDAINSDSIRSYMTHLAGFETRFMLADNRRDIAVWIADQFKSFGLSHIAIDSFQNTLEFPLKSGTMNTTWQYNVVATMKGADHPDSGL